MTAVDQRGQLRVVAHPLDALQEVQSGGYAHALGQHLGPLVELAFASKSLGRHLAAKPDRAGPRLEAEAGDELHAAQNAQRILGEMRRDVTEHAALEIPKSVPRVDHLVRQRVAVDCVYGEVSAGGGVLYRERRIILHLERLVSEAKLRLAAGDGDVDVMSVQLYDAEGCADEIEAEAFGEYGLQPLRVKAVDLNVEILGGAAKQRVAHASADQQGASAGGLYTPRDIKYGLGVIRHTAGGIGRSRWTKPSSSLG